MKYIFSFMASLLLLAGCSGDFLDKEPTDSVSSDESRCARQCRTVV